jgi:hypothetical protein
LSDGLAAVFAVYGVCGIFGSALAAIDFVKVDCGLVCLGIVVDGLLWF